MPFTYYHRGYEKLPFKLRQLPVFFSDESCMEIIELVLEEKGAIRNFPGIVKDPRWESKHNIGQCYDVRFEAQFYALAHDRFLMLWLIQPNGMHWMDDDGFGITNDESIMLYSILDRNGNFTKEFALFSIDQTLYCHDFDEVIE